jgi:hypothetical protein
MPAQAATFLRRRHSIAREEDSNPPRLGRGDTRGSTEARDHFSNLLPWPNISGTCLLSGFMQARILPGAPQILSTHRVCGPPVKRCELGAMPRGGATFSEGARPDGRGSCLEHSRTFHGVQGSSPWRSATSPSFPTPAWCNSSMADSLSADLGALPSAGAIFLFLRPIAQKESGRPTPGRPWSITTSGDHFLSRSIVQKQNGRPTSDRLGSVTPSSDQFSFTLCSSKAEPSPDKRETVARYHAEGPFISWLRS